MAKCPNCESLAEAHALALDNLAGVMEAVLWGITERTIEKYGVGAMPEEEPPCIHDPDESGACRNCGHSPFLGADNKEKN